MFSKRVWALLTPVAALLATLVVASPASAATNSFGCRASVARVSLLNGAVPAVEPFVANPNESPCATDTAGASTGDVIDLSSLNLGSLNLGGLDLGTLLGSVTNQLAGNLTVGPVAADTNSVATSSSMSASSLASVSGLTIPTPAGDISVVGPAQATAGYECAANGAVQETNGSTLTALEIAGKTIQLPPNGGELTIPLSIPGLLGLGSTSLGSITVNGNTQTATSNTEQLLNINLDNLVDIVVGEAQVTTPASGACSGINTNPPGGTTGTTGPGGTTGGNGPGGNNGNGGTSGTSGNNGPGGTNGNDGSSASSVCPVGSTLVAASGLCEIVSSTGSGTGTKVVTIGAPDSGDIVGAKVISLAAARAKYKSICLNGLGPKYVVVGTNGANKITVKGVRMRVLALGGKDTVTVKSGKNTCVDGGAGNDTIKDTSKTRARLYGLNGNDKITIANGRAYAAGGNGNDVLKAGNGKVTLLGNDGNDKITAGKGNDQLNGDAGNDVITAGTGVDRLNGGPGENTMTAKGRKAYLKATGGKSTGYLVKSNVNKKFARTHGVKLKTLA